LPDVVAVAAPELQLRSSATRHTADMIHGPPRFLWLTRAPPRLS
jgi:hypothetical protein